MTTSTHPVKLVSPVNEGRPENGDIMGKTDPAVTAIIVQAEDLAETEQLLQNAGIFYSTEVR